MKSNRNLFRHKHLAALLVIASVLLAIHYFSANLSKLRSTLRFFYLQESEQALQRSGKSAITVIDVKRGGRSLIKRYFYSPFCTAYDYSLYALPCDLRDRASLAEVQVEVDGRPGRFNRLFVFRDFSIVLEESSHKAYAFIHSDYLATLQKLRKSREIVIGQLLLGTSSGGVQILVLNEEIQLRYAGQQDGDWVERIWDLPPFETRLYEIRFEYRVTLGARPYFIIGQHPTWFVHEKLPVSIGSDQYSPYRIVAAAPKTLGHPALILRNWGGVGTAFFKNVEIRLMDRKTKAQQGSFRYDLGDVGGIPDARPLGGR